MVVSFIIADIKIALHTYFSNSFTIVGGWEVRRMLKVKQVKIFESSDVNIFENSINEFIKKSKEPIMDVKYEVSKIPNLPEFVEDFGEEETRYTALVLIGEEI